MPPSDDPNAPGVYVDDEGHVYYRASALGGCFTSLVAARLKYVATKPAATVQKAYDRGHSTEAKVKDMMRAEGWKIWDEQARVEVPISSRISIVGSIDGKVMGKVGGEIMLGELKSQSHDEWDNFARYGWDSGLWPKYKWQVSSYMIATELPAAVVRARVDKSGEIDGIDIEYIGQPFYTTNELRLKVLTAEWMAQRMELPQCDKPIFGCPYWYLPEHDPDVNEGRMQISEESFEEVCVEYEKARAEAKRYKDERDRLRPLVDSEIVTRAGDGAQKLLTVGGVKVTKYEQNNPPRTDWSQMIEDGVLTEEVVSTYTSQSKGWRLRVTLPKGYGDG